MCYYERGYQKPKRGMKMNYGRKTILFVAISAGLLCGCSKSEKPLTAYDAQYLDYFDTITSITINAKSEKEFEKYKSLAEDTLEKYHELFDIYDNYDGVNKRQEEILFTSAMTGIGQGLVGGANNQLGLANGIDSVKAGMSYYIWQAFSNLGGFSAGGCVYIVADYASKKIFEGCPASE